MNESYTAQEQMQKGFKTFILTLSVSLIIFSVIYYFISDAQNNTNIDVSAEEVSQEITNETAVVNEPEKLEESTLAVNSMNIEESDEEDTVFGKLSEAPVAVTSRAVLAGSTTNPTGTGTTQPKVTKQTTTGAVPNGGVTELTWGFFISLISFTLGFIVISKDPRKMAIQHFEKKMLEE